ncbi:hypothetical protein [Bacillus subtilis]|uniref:hypothetical protein n=1 Tax=Bacillus subtilis TaxID=1423 RepID=UPI00119EB380|nr:hypothetical protein [Bacillus subtilis]
MPGVLEVEGKVNRERMERGLKEVMKREEWVGRAFEEEGGGDGVEWMHEEVGFRLESRVVGGGREEEGGGGFMKGFDVREGGVLGGEMVKV